MLNQIASEKGSADSDYKTSIVDLMRLLGLDSSLENREELATELAYTGANDSSAEMNIWLYKQVVKQLAAHGRKLSGTEQISGGHCAGPIPLSASFSEL